MIPFGKTILLDSKGKSYRTEPIGNLSYLLSFLDSYDFGSIYEKTENATENESSKQLISSSVLGLIFEKMGMNKFWLIHQRAVLFLQNKFRLIFTGMNKFWLIHQRAVLFLQNKFRLIFTFR